MKKDAELFRKSGKNHVIYIEDSNENSYQNLLNQDMRQESIKDIQASIGAQSSVFAAP